MDQNKIVNFKTLENIQEAAKSVSGENRKQLRRSIFESLMKEVNAINPGLGGFEELSMLLALPEEEFAIIAPIFLDELQKSVNNIDDKLTLIQAMNMNGVKLEDLQDIYKNLYTKIDEEFKNIIPDSRRDFLKRMLSITYNTIAETAGVAKRIIDIPIELTSENAKIPQYAKIGDGALDLYSPADYCINPGETVLIPVDIKVALPYGYAFLIHPRSGTSLKSKLRIANSIGLIDSQYKGVIGVIVENIAPPIQDIEYEFDEQGRPVIKSIQHGSNYYISKGERFAQMRLVEVPTAHFFQVDNIAEYGDDRGGGFGSTGIN